MLKTIFQTLEVGSQDIRPVVCFFLSVFTMKTGIGRIGNVAEATFTRRAGVDLLPTLYLV